MKCCSTQFKKKRSAQFHDPNKLATPFFKRNKGILFMEIGTFSKINEQEFV
jgi:hypothetical protein